MSPSAVTLCSCPPHFRPSRGQEPSGAPVPLELTVGPAAPQLRADAARNRARLLEAATRLVEEHGVANVTMEAVAAAASVGKGTRLPALR